MNSMRRVLVVGTGYVAKPAIDYLLDRGYEVTVVSRDARRSRDILREKPNGFPAHWTGAPDYESLEMLIRRADLVVSFLPPHMHSAVAKMCVQHCTHFIAPSYVHDEMQVLHEEARSKDLVLLNEIGESPGLDHMAAMKLLGDLNGTVTGFSSYSGGLPALGSPRNPLNYNVSWSPRGLVASANAPACYFMRGHQVRVSPEDLFQHVRLVDIEGFGVFETHPNRDSTRYVSLYGLPPRIDFYRGLLRYCGFCSVMHALRKLGFLDLKEQCVFPSMTTYRKLITLRVGPLVLESLEDKVASTLRLGSQWRDVIRCFEWLGLFGDNPVPISNGTLGDVLSNLFSEKLSYAPHQRDMILVSNEAVVELEGGSREKHTLTIYREGNPYKGVSAMSLATGLSVAIAAQLILEGKVHERGVVLPVVPSLYMPILYQLQNEFGFAFRYQTQDL